MAAPKDPPREPSFRPGADPFGRGDEPPMYADDADAPIRPVRRPDPLRPDEPRLDPLGDARAAPAQPGGPYGAGARVAAPGAGWPGRVPAASAPSPAPGDGGPARPLIDPEIEALRARLAEAQAREHALEARAKELEAAAAKAEASATEAQDGFLRASAEVENVRRRAREDIAKTQKFAIEGFAEALLPVKDSLEMALKVDVPSIESLKEGVEATLRQLAQAFERNRLLEIDPLHQKFDPNQHQAISLVPSADVAPNHVVSVLQKGYLINDRVLRPALVTVSQAT